jgi:hypothetical protein
VGQRSRAPQLVSYAQPDACVECGWWAHRGCDGDPSGTVVTSSPRNGRRRLGANHLQSCGTQNRRVGTLADPRLAVFGVPVLMRQVGWSVTDDNRRSPRLAGSRRARGRGRVAARHRLIAATCRRRATRGNARARTCRGAGGGNDVEGGVARYITSRGSMAGTQLLPNSTGSICNRHAVTPLWITNGRIVRCPRRNRGAGSSTGWAGPRALR